MVIGFALIAAVLYDVARVALSARGHGPILRSIGRLGWHLKRILPVGALGPMVLLMGFLTWALLLWLGWTLVFSGSADSVLHDKSSTPASFLDRVYFVGFNITTLGIGDFVPSSNVWELLTIFAAVSGFCVLTLGLTFLISLLPAVIQKRLVAHTISTLGRTPQEIAGRQWVGDSCQLLQPYIPDLVFKLESLRLYYVAYPMLHYFFAPERESCLALQLAKLNETLLLFESGAVSCEKTTRALVPLRGSLKSFLATLETLHPLEASDGSPAVPSLAGIPPEVATNEGADIAGSAAGIEQQRRLLNGYLEAEGYSWDDLNR